MKFNKTQLAALALLLTTASSQADAVIIQNNSFENPGGGTGQYPSADNWYGSSFTEISADVLLTGGHLARYAGQNSGNTATQDLGVGFLADSQYTLTILIGHRTTDAVNPTGTATFGLTAGGIDLGDFTQVTPAQVVDNTFQEFTYTFNTGAVAPTGNIGISLGALGGRAAFDNVRLNVGVRNSDFKITAISRPGNGNVQLSFVSQPGQSYGVESSLTLAQGSWVNTGVTATGTGAIQTVEVQDNNSTQRRFFRIKELGAAVLATPGNPVATAYSRSLVDFTWTDVAGETGYEVQWDEASNFASPTTLLPLSSNKTSALVSGLNPSTQYYFRVRALKTASSPSEYAVANATTQATNTSGVISTGGTVTPSSEPYAGEEGVLAFDGLTNTKWLGNMTPEGAWLSYTFAGPRRVTGFKITSANDNPNRHPRNFKLQGSLDGSNWVDIAGSSVANQPYVSQFNEVEYGCPANVTSYPQVRLFISTNNGNTDTGLGGSGLLQLAELVLLGEL